MRKALWVVGLLLVATPAWAQLSDASFKTFTAGTLIKAADINGNFAVILDQALNRRGGTLTGNLTVSAGITIDGRDISADLDQAVKTTSSPTFVTLTATTVTATTLAGAGSGITGLNAANLASGTVPLARLSGLTSAQFASANVSQWTNDAGYVTASGAVPSGSIVFTAGSCAAGWTDLSTTYAGRYVVISGTVNTTGVGTALTNAENRATGQHNHTATSTDSGHTHTVASWETTSGDHYGGSEAGSGQYGTVTSGSGTANITTTVANQGSVAGTNAPYIQLKACQKD